MNAVATILSILTIALIVRGTLAIYTRRNDRAGRVATARAELEARLVVALHQPIDHVAARLTVRGRIAAGETATLVADAAIAVYSSTALRSEARRGPFLPRQILIDNGDAFAIVDVRCGGRTQFAAGTGGVPADIFHPRYAGLADVSMDTLAPGDIFEMIVKNSSDRELAFAAVIDGRYVPPQSAPAPRAA